MPSTSRSYRLGHAIYYDQSSPRNLRGPSRYYQCDDWKTVMTTQKITPDFEAQLKGTMDQEQWDKFYPLCKEWGVPINDESLEYGSIFIMCKVWFTNGWEAKPVIGSSDKS